MRSIAAPPPLIPARDFAGGVTFEDPVLSPDGKAIAAEYQNGNRRLLVIHEVVGGGEKGTRSFDLGEAEINWTRWPDDGHVVVSLRQMAKIAGVDLSLPQDRLILLNRDGTGMKGLGPLRASLSADDVIYWAPDGSYLLLNVARSLFEWPAVVRVDLPSGNLTTLQKPRAGTSLWVADSQGVVVAGIGFFGSRLKVIYRPTPASPWATALRYRLDSDEADPVYIAKIDGLTQRGHVVSRHGGDRWGLYEYDFRTKQFGAPLFENPEYDLADYDYDNNGALRWVSHIEDRTRFTWMDAANKAFYDDLGKAVPDKTLTVASTSASGEVRLVFASSATDPGSYYYYTADSGRMKLLARANETLAGATLAPTTYTRYTARDGVAIPAYLTMPVGREPSALPLIVMPHGGPFVRDDGSFDFLAQYLANRGYVVLQPNFRGSIGYGRKFEELGYGEFGKAMQDDVDDGVSWLVGAGKVDPARVCIVGWSYGGYVAQVAAFRNPGTYRCAASVAGISDLAAMIRYDRRFMWGSNFRKWRAKVQGDASTRELKAVSALTQVSGIRVPL
ncbi:MAG: S9 family peptidase, partial [Gammaproteobacteria bacterium]|nr:S9 family peptidase [Gammaproteobacteria bacterium]